MTFALRALPRIVAGRPAVSPCGRPAASLRAPPFRLYRGAQPRNRNADRRRNRRPSNRPPPRADWPRTFAVACENQPVNRVRFRTFRRLRSCDADGVGTLAHREDAAGSNPHMPMPHTQ